MSDPNFNSGLFQRNPLNSDTLRTMNADTRKYFKYLDLVREDVREVLDLIGLEGDIKKVVDYGCGKGLETYGFSMELDGSECLGVDRFDGEITPRLETILGHAEEIRRYCDERVSGRYQVSPGLCRLVRDNRLPAFRQGDVVLGEKLPRGYDLAYCNKLLVNILKGTPEQQLPGEEGMLAAIKHMAGSVRRGGLVCAVEFDGLALDAYFRQTNLKLVDRHQFKRREVRSRGRTNVVSRYVLYVCEKV
jgi:hypothetical protein